MTHSGSPPQRSQLSASLVVGSMKTVWKRHASTHKPHELHFSSSITTAPVFSSLLIADVGQTAMTGHLLHCRHASGHISANLIISGDPYPCPRRIILPVVTESTSDLTDPATSAQFWNSHKNASRNIGCQTAHSVTPSTTQDPERYPQGLAS